MYFLWPLEPHKTLLNFPLPTMFLCLLPLFFITPRSFLVLSFSDYSPYWVLFRTSGSPLPWLIVPAIAKLTQFFRPWSYISLLEARSSPYHRKPIILFKVSDICKPETHSIFSGVCLIRQLPSCFPPSHSGLLSQLL